MDVTYVGALIAGVLSFLSPCVLPLVPPYLCFLGGTTFDQLAGDHHAIGSVCAAQQQRGEWVVAAGEAKISASSKWMP